MLKNADYRERYCNSIALATSGNFIIKIYMEGFFFSLFNVFRPWISESVDNDPADKGGLLYILH